MAVKLRLMRMGKKKQPTYRVVAADSRSPRDGRFIEIVGVYDPRPDPSAIRIDNDKAVDWLRKGAQPTESVRKLLVISGAWETFSGEAPSRPAREPLRRPPARRPPSRRRRRPPPRPVATGRSRGRRERPETGVEAEAGVDAERRARVPSPTQPLTRVPRPASMPSPTQTADESAEESE